jgi:MoxR-like ATPase
MSAAERCQIDKRRITKCQCRIETGGAQVVGDRIEPRAALRVASTHIVQTALGVCEHEGGHSGAPAFSVKVPRMADNNDVTRLLTALVDQISTIIVGKRAQIEDCVSCLLAGGHLLIEDVPGVGKTTLAHALAVSLGLKFSRVQFTADLMPSDLVGVSVYERSKETFVFHPGPVFAQVLLADEINRAGPKTQSALLEAMEEHQVTVENETRALPKPFFVIATQNPVDQLGTYPLPESQLDRFLMCITLGYPDRASERALLTGEDRRGAIERLKPVMTAATLTEAQTHVHRVHAADALLDYLQSLIAATRSGQWFVEGLSPRAGIAWLRAARARALMARRNYVAPDDVQAVAPQTIAHRLLPVAGAGRGRVEQVRAMLESIALP